MAHMFPPHLTPGFSADAVPSEKRVYDKLAAELDNSFSVFHDLKWDDPAIDDSHTVGQADFVLAHPEYGFIVLEIKGGRCSYDATRRLWQTEDRRGAVAVITDPFDQAEAGARVLRKLLIQHCPGILRRSIRSDFAALFPDCALPDRSLRANVPAWRLMDIENLFNFKQSIHNLFGSAFSGERIARADGLNVVDGLKQLWGVHDLQGRLRLDLRLKQSFERLSALTDEQLDVLTSLGQMPRVLVTGCAGSGKTTLAVHKAKMLADDGKRVGFFCFNIPLARHLSRKCESHGNITVGPIAELLQEWLTEAGVPLHKEDTDDWWNVTLPTLVVDNLDLIPHRFDALVVDEGQDIRENYWTGLELLLDDRAGQVIYIFSDGSQNLYHGKMNLSIEVSPYSLTRNIRNTNQVFQAVKACCGIPETIKPSGVDGPRPRLYRCSDDAELHRHLQLIIERLCAEAVAPADITILGTKSQARTSLRHGEKIGSFRLVETREKPGDIVSMTVKRFKGLEAGVVILCELDDKTLNLNELLYVGMTRTTGLLIAIATGAVYDRLRKAGFQVMDEGGAGERSLSAG